MAKPTALENPILFQGCPEAGLTSTVPEVAFHFHSVNSTFGSA